MSADSEQPAGSPPVVKPPTRVPQHDVGRWLRLARKELRETLRDRRTIVTLLLMPILVYPLLSIGFRHFLLGSYTESGKWSYVIGVESPEARTVLEQDIVSGDALVRGGRQGEMVSQRDAPGERRPETSETPDDIEPSRGDLSTRILPDLDQSVSAGECDLAVRIQQLPVGTAGQVEAVHHRYELIYRKDSPPSRVLAQFVERRLGAVNQYDLQRRLLESRQTDLVPTSWSFRSVAVKSNQSLTMLIPLILILMTITGAVYPAIDLTAGERERGTLESLMAAPVPRLGMLFAKYVAVVTVALLTAVMNLTAMFVTAYSMGLSQYIFGPEGLTVASIALVVLLLILFAAFFSAVLLAVTSFAKSFKEAQAYLIPLMLLAISPGLFTLMPGMKMNALLAVTPLLNMVLLARDVLEGTSHPILAGMAVVSTSLYALLAIALAARVFGSDAMLFGSQSSWGDLLRRPEQPRLTPTLAGVALTTALVFAFQSVGGGIVAAMAGEDASLEFAYIGSALVTVCLYLLIPLMMAAMQFVSLPAAFQMRLASPLAFVGALLLGLSLWPLAHELVLFSGLANPELFDKVREHALELRAVSPLVLIACVAIAPPVCEEWFFRGYLLGALRPRTSAWSAIVLTALLFGLFHVFTTIVLAVRFLPSMSLGIVLGYVCWRTRSVWPGMLLHAVHNGLLILMGHYQPQLQEWGFGASETEHVPVLWLVASVAVAMLGISLVWLSGPSAAADESQPALKPATS